MSVLEKVVESVKPTESEKDRREARVRARQLASPGSWLALVVQQHERIEAAFDRAKISQGAAGGRAAQRQLALLLTGHSNAEEAVIYPALARCGEKGQAEHAYSEQATAKMEMATLEQLIPGSEEYFSKLETIRAAVAHHMYEEEDKWFQKLVTGLPASEEPTITRQFSEQFERYMGEDGIAEESAATTNGVRVSATAPPGGLS